MSKIINFSGKINESISFELIEKIISKNRESWKYIWFSPCQIADKYKDFCGFLSLEDLDSVRKSINSVNEKKGFITELKLFADNATFYILSDGNAENTRWSCWLRNEANFEGFTIFYSEKEALTFDNTLVVKKSVLLRRNLQGNLDKVHRGLGKAGINDSKLNFDCYYSEGNLKCWFLGGK